MGHVARLAQKHEIAGKLLKIPRKSARSKARLAQFFLDVEKIAKAKTESQLREIAFGVDWAVQRKLFYINSDLSWWQMRNDATMLLENRLVKHILALHKIIRSSEKR